MRSERTKWRCPKWGKLDGIKERARINKYKRPHNYYYYSGLQQQKQQPVTSSILGHFQPCSHQKKINSEQDIVWTLRRRRDVSRIHFKLNFEWNWIIKMRLHWLIDNNNKYLEFVKSRPVVSRLSTFNKPIVNWMEQQIKWPVLSMNSPVGRQQNA